MTGQIGAVLGVDVEVVEGQGSTSTTGFLLLDAATLVLLGADGAKVREHLLHHARGRYFILLIVLGVW
jgi:hypothetical protein